MAMVLPAPRRASGGPFEGIAVSTVSDDRGIMGLWPPEITKAEKTDVVQIDDIDRVMSRCWHAGASPPRTDARTQ